MRVVLAVVLLLMSLVSNAQSTFAPEGAQWLYYLPANGGPFYPETEEITTFSGDTVIAGIDAKKLVTERRTIDHFNGGNQSTTSSQKFIAVANDSILLLVNNQWELIFSFGASVGDSIAVFVGELVGSGCDGHGMMVIESISDSVFNGVSLQAFSYRMFAGADQEGVVGHYFGRIGFTSDGPVTHPLYCDYPGSYFQPKFYCYSDNEILVSPSNGCGQILSIDFDLPQRAEIQLQNQIVKVNHTSNSILRVYDILGKELLQESITSDSQSFNLNHLPNGILMVVVESETGRFTKKLVKASY